MLKLSKEQLIARIKELEERETKCIKCGHKGTYKCYYHGKHLCDDCVRIRNCHWQNKMECIYERLIKIEPLEAE